MRDASSLFIVSNPFCSAILSLVLD